MYRAVLPVAHGFGSCADSSNVKRNWVFPAALGDVNLAFQGRHRMKDSLTFHQ